MSFAPVFPERWDPIRWWARTTPHRISLVEPARGIRLSYAEFDALCDGWAAWLQAHGVQAGDRVALLAPNCTHACALFFAALRCGAALVPLNWRLAPNEIDAVLDDARPALALHHDTLTAPAGGAWLRLPATPDPGSDVRTRPPRDSASPGPGAAECASHAPRRVPGANPSGHGTDAEQPALVLYTSGSTGRPKGVVLPLRQILYNAIATCTAWELGPTDSAPISTPLFHTGGWNVFATPLWHCGGRVVLVDRFDADGFLGMLAEEQCTVALTVPTQLVMLRAAADWGRPLPALRRFFSGGAPCPAALAESVRAAGYTLREGYGLTECGPNCFVISDTEAVSRPGSVGRPILFLQARICDDAGADLPAGEAGELWLRGPQMFSGYFGDARRTAEVVTADGWLRTGDLAVRADDGCFSICGRRREMYISGGENVFPGEVEAALASCPGIVDVAVIGVPDATWGEVGHAFVVVRPGGPDGAAVLGFARDRLAGYKVPRQITFMSELPRLGSGKIDRRSLQRLAVSQPA
jgi:fatty-acyl-CoA synthase